MEAPPIFVGIDVSKAQLDVAIRPSAQTLSVTNDQAGIKILIKQFKKLRPSLVVLESTGGLERQVISALLNAKIAVFMVNPRHVRDFAKSIGQLAKTDRVDAAVIAHYAEAVRPKVRPLPDQSTLELKALMARRRQVIEMIVAEKNRLVTACEAVKKRITAHIAYLEKGTRVGRPGSRRLHRAKCCLETEPRNSLLDPKYWAREQPYPAH